MLWLRGLPPAEYLGIVWGDHLTQRSVNQGHNLSSRDLWEMIDKGRGWSEYLKYIGYLRLFTNNGYILTPPHTFIWHSQMRVENDILGDGRITRTRKEPKQQSTKCSRKPKVKEKGKTRKMINFSQEILSSKRIPKELKSKQQVPN